MVRKSFLLVERRVDAGNLALISSPLNRIEQGSSLGELLFANW